MGVLLCIIFLDHFLKIWFFLFEQTLVNITIVSDKIIMVYKSLYKSILITKIP